MKAWKILTSFVVPVMALFGAMSLQEIAFSSTAATAIVVAFMTLKLLLEHLVVEPAIVPYAQAGREGEARAYTALLLSALAFGTLLLFKLSTH